MNVLGIETSCDETAAAVVVDGTKMLSSIVSSQVEVHHPYGGVVPELASRKHIENIISVVDKALSTAGIDQKEIDAVAATQGPGLAGALLVGFSFAKAYAYALGVSFAGVNHLEGHVNSVFLESDPPPFPFVALLVSGGHTGLYYVKSHTEMTLLGQTRDDAAGEAFDKVAKMLDLGYPGGTVISNLSKKGDPGKINFPRPFLDKNGCDFSFSGLKTAVNRYIQEHSDKYKDEQNDIAAGFQEAVVDVLSIKLITTAKRQAADHVALVGGVAANERLRDRVKKEAAAQGLTLHIPSINLCGDNAAMIAAIGYHYLKEGRRSDMNSDVYSRVHI